MQRWDELLMSLKAGLVRLQESWPKVWVPIRLAWTLQCKSHEGLLLWRDPGFTVSLPWKPPKSKRALSKAHLSSHEKPPFADTAFNFRISCSPDVNSMKSLNKSSPEERQSRVQARNSSLDYQTRQVGNLMATSVTTVAPNLQPMGLSWVHFAARKIYLIISASNAIEIEKVAHINCYQWYSYCFYVHL